ncbi:hypothetical protein [Cyanobacterium sp. HL-69]|uniref:hypothetical protein n=1 Tax=Cyanobacterium sp. HL-69 TaxID=2054282 RepID=UPI00406BA5EE
MIFWQRNNLYLRNKEVRSSFWKGVRCDKSYGGLDCRRCLGMVEVRSSFWEGVGCDLDKFINC